MVMLLVYTLLAMRMVTHAGKHVFLLFFQCASKSLLSPAINSQVTVNTNILQSLGPL